MKAQDATHLINEIRRLEDNGDYEPSDWEDEFLTSIENQIATGKTSLSEKQKESLEKIYQTATEGECYR